MRFFEEAPTFPFDRCGTCDNCQKAHLHKGDEKRDFADESFALFRSMALNSGKGVKAIVDSAVLDAKYSEKLLLKWRNKTTLSTVLKSLIAILSAEGCVSSETKSFQTTGQFSAAYTSHTLTPKGRRMLDSSANTTTTATQQIILPVPQAVREWEYELEQKKQLLMERLRREQIDPRLVPNEELLMEAESGLEGSWLKWHRSLLADRAQGRDQSAGAKEELFRRIMKWRGDTAVALEMAPERVIQVSAMSIVIIIIMLKG